MSSFSASQHQLLLEEVRVHGSVPGGRLAHERDETAGAYEKQLPVPQLAYVLDFFCGCGGMSAGFLQTRQSHIAFRILAGIDKDQSALESFQTNIGAPGICADVRELGAHPAKLRAIIPWFMPEAMRPLVFIGCAPCQGFSALRKGDDRDDERNSLMRSFASIVEYYRPDYVVMENVPEIVTGKFAHYYAGAASKLRKCGYDLSESVVDLSLYGVPQRRRRAVVLGALTGPVHLQAAPLTSSTARTVREAIGQLPPLRAGEVDPRDVNHRAPEHTPRMIALFEQIPRDGGDRRSIPRDLQLAAHRRLDQSETPGFTDVYGRLRWDAPSVTITAKSRSPSSGRFLHPEQHRNITVREAALLQGFPLRYVFCGPPTQQYRQVGEAVPPLFARFVAASILDHIRPLKPRETLPTNWPRPSVSRSRSATMAPVVVDAFCGAGGLSLGFVRAGLRVAFAFDSDSDAIATYRNCISDCAEVADITDPDLAHRVSDAVSQAPVMVIGGPPCQGFSHQRKGHSDDPRNHMVLHFAKFIESLRSRPLAVVLENVTDLELPRGRHILGAFVRRMSALGLTAYRHILNAADFCTPQIRRRVIMVFLSPMLAPHYREPRPLTPDRWLTIGEALIGLPEPSEHDLTRIPNHVPAQETEPNRRRIAFVGMGEGRRSIPDEFQLPCHAGDYRGHRDVFGRMDWFSLSRTITGGFDSFTRGEFAHPFRNRSITHREGARLQGFPDWFAFEGNRAATRRQIGNAVPPGMAYAIAEALRSAFKKAGAH